MAELPPPVNELETASISRLLIRFSIPAITGTVVTSLYNVVDRIFLGKYVGENGIAATTVAFPLMLIMMACGMLIGFGTNSQISIMLGRKDQNEAERLLGQGVLMFVLFSVLFTGAGIVFMKPLLKLFGASAVVVPFAEDYLSIILYGTLSHMFSFGVNNFIRGEGSPKTAMATMLIGGLLNIVFDYVFIVRFGWGMKGAAWATILGYTVSGLWVLWYFVSGQSVVRLRLINLRFRWESVKRVLVMGSPHFLMNLVASLQMAIFNNQLAAYGGDLAISVMGVIMSFNYLWLMPIVGISQGLQPIAGYNHGAGKPRRVRRAFLLAIVAGTVFCSAVFFLISLRPEAIFSLFTSDPDSELIDSGVEAMKIFLIFLPAIGFMIITGNYFQFIGRPKISLILMLSRQVLFLIPSLLILPTSFGLNGVWYAGPVSDGGALLATGVFFLWELRSLAKRIRQAEGE